MSADNSGPAFPAMSWDSEGEFLGANNGMTLRDYLAAKAMQSMVIPADAVAGDFRLEAASAYRIADAMLKERAK